MKPMNFRTFLKLFGKLLMSILPGFVPFNNPFLLERRTQPIREEYRRRY
ncbi:MAG: hypothetical protein KJZ72_12810 [Anaerolineales bacterium]|nr:hypothetical protein [Anaerolineales bacterium]